MRLQITLENAKKLDALLMAEDCVGARALLACLVDQQLARRVYGHRIGYVLKAWQLARAERNYAAAAVLERLYESVRKEYRVRGYGECR